MAVHALTGRLTAAGLSALAALFRILWTARYHSVFFLPYGCRQESVD